MIYTKQIRHTAMHPQNWNSLNLGCGVTKFSVHCFYRASLNFLCFWAPFPHLYPVARSPSDCALRDKIRLFEKEKHTTTTIVWSQTIATEQTKLDWEALTPQWMLGHRCPLLVRSGAAVVTERRGSLEKDPWETKVPRGKGLARGHRVIFGYSIWDSWLSAFSRGRRRRTGSSSIMVSLLLDF